MPLRKLFWILSAFTIAFLILQVLGYSVLEVIVSLLLMDIAVVEISRQEDRHRMENQLKPELLTRIGNVEKLCSNIMSSINALPTIEHFYQVAEDTIYEHKARLKEEIKEDLDRLAKRAIEIENRLYDMKKAVAMGIESLDNRLRAMETGNWTFSSEEVKVVSPVSKEIDYGENDIE